MATIAVAAAPRRSSVWRKFSREPMLHFLLAGLLLFLIGQYLEHRRQQPVIVFGPEQIARIASAYQKQYGVAPTPVQLKSLVASALREEVFYREGLVLGLDKDDEIVRRRVVQKFEFLQQDLSVPAEPTSEQLADYFEQHQSAYIVPAQRTFSHVYFSPDRGGDAGARVRAARVLARLRTAKVQRAPQFGDRFVDHYDYVGINQADVERIFGRSQFSEGLFQAQVGQWYGPLRSGYGWHLIYVSGEVPARIPSLDQVRQQVRNDYLAQLRQQADDVAYRKLLDKYRIVRGDTP